MKRDIIKDCRVEMSTDVNITIESFIISSLQDKYPDCVNWLYNKVIPQLRTDDRNLFLLYHEENLIGFSITKKKSDDRIKICSLFIKKSFRNLGCGTILLRTVVNYHKNMNMYLSFRCERDELYYIHNFITKFGFRYNKKHLVSNKMLDIFYEYSISEH